MSAKHASASCAEVVLFTAGLEDYAKPIADELDRRYGDVFHHRLYRPATRTCSAYPCLKVQALPAFSAAPLLTRAVLRAVLECSGYILIMDGLKGPACEVRWECDA